MNPLLLGFSEYQTVCSKKLHKKCNEGKSGGRAGREKRKICQCCVKLHSTK